VITRQPKDILAAVGQTFVVEVGADGIPVPACQWQRQTAGTSRWEDLSDGQEATGCHRTILTVKNTSPTMRGDKFRCVVSNAEGLAESLSAVLEVQVNGAFVLAGEPGQYGNADGASSLARFAYPGGLAVDSNGDFYVADSHGHTIRKVSPQGEVTTFAGRPDSKGYRDGPVHTAQFDWPRAVALGADGTLYVTDHGNSVVRQISPEGDVSTLAGGPGNPGSKDGPGDVALFRCPWGIVVDGEGTVFVSDVCDNTVRRVTPGGIVSTFAGLAGVRGAEDGPGNIARFRDPTGMAVDQTGNVYVADLSNNTIRKISPEGMVSTIAGVPQKKGNLDGPANQALFNAPSALAVDHAGNVYVADRGNNNVRKISLNGMVTTIAGPDENRVPPSYSANMRRPAGIAIAPGGLYVADTENQVLWWIVFPPEPPVLRIVRKERSIQLSYEPTSGDFILEAAESMEPGAVWLPQELPVRPSSHHPALELPISSATRFFRLRSR
jgi:sugar lactone lactonase YvrE